MLFYSLTDRRFLFGRGFERRNVLGNMDDGDDEIKMSYEDIFKKSKPQKPQNRVNDYFKYVRAEDNQITGQRKLANQDSVINPQDVGPMEKLRASDRPTVGKTHIEPPQGVERKLTGPNPLSEMEKGNFANIGRQGVGVLNDLGAETKDRQKSKHRWYSDGVAPNESHSNRVSHVGKQGVPGVVDPAKMGVVFMRNMTLVSESVNTTHTWPWGGSVNTQERYVHDLS